MQTNSWKAASNKFPLRLMPSVRKRGGAVFGKRRSFTEQFINVAIAEKLAHLEHDEWLARRAKPTAARIARALEVLSSSKGKQPEPDDRLPKGYSSISSK